MNSSKRSGIELTDADRPHKLFKANPTYKMGFLNPHMEERIQGRIKRIDWNKYKQTKKNFKINRKLTKKFFEIFTEAKQIYEKLRCRKTQQKCELAYKLYNVLNTDHFMVKTVKMHSTARILQCVLKYATSELREEIVEQLIPLVIDMATSKYAHFCILRILKYNSSSMNIKLIDALMGHIVKLSCHSISSKVLDKVYLVATEKQKSYMRQEFYCDLYKNFKNDNVCTLSDTYKLTPSMKTSVLGYVKSNLERVANKHLIDNSLIHAVILEYMEECEDDKIEETIAMYAPLTPQMLTTRDGCRAAILCFYKSLPKYRRAVIKSIKEHLVKICVHEHGHLVIISILNALDDTKAIKKAIYDSINCHIYNFVNNQWGRRVVMWLISPASMNYFHPKFISNIEEGLKYSKKDKDIRRQEIFQQIEDSISISIVEQPELWLANNQIGIVTAELLRKLNKINYVKVASSLINIIVQPSWSVKIVKSNIEKEILQMSNDDEQVIINRRENFKKNEWNKLHHSQNSVLGIEEAGLHIILKKIIKNDKDRLIQDVDTETFGSLLVDALTEDTLRKWLTINRACFILLNVIENNSEKTRQQLKVLIQPIQDLLKDEKNNGAQILQKKLF